MSKFKLINRLDAIFVSLAVFFITFAWFNFYLKNIILSLFLSFFCSFFLLFILFSITKSKRDKKNRLKSREDDINNTFFAFQMLNLNNQLKTISDMIPKNYETTIENDHISLDVLGTKTAIFPLVEKIQKSNLIELLKVSKDYSHIIIISEGADSDAMKFMSSLKNVSITLIDKIDLYELLTAHEIKLEMPVEFKNNKLSFKTIRDNFFARSHFKGFFFSGLILIISSLIIPFKIYYIIFGSVLILFSIICRLPKKNISKKNWLEK